MSERTRAEHMAWCKQRAMQEFDYYAKEEGIPAAVRNASASMLSDVGKHPETAGLRDTVAMLMMLPMRSRADVQRFIEGFV